MKGKRGNVYFTPCLFYSTCDATNLKLIKKHYNNFSSTIDIPDTQSHDEEAVAALVNARVNPECWDLSFSAKISIRWNLSKEVENYAYDELWHFSNK